MVELNDFAAVKTKNATVFSGSNLDVLPFMADNSVDAIVTDPPYELGFMGKSWDSSGIAYNVELWRECLRVLKPGGHLLAFGGSRTWHRIAVAIEDAGFDVRDSIAWLYGSGFPKSHDISKAIDKAAGAEREVLSSTFRGMNAGKQSGILGKTVPRTDVVTVPSTPEAQQWQGWGTALKPAFEPVVVARKPLIGTVAQNVLEWGVGGLNIDASRIGTDDDRSRPGSPSGIGNGGVAYGTYGDAPSQSHPYGRWPANIILDSYTAELLDEQTDELGASRFFYVAKASKRDRNEGLNHLEDGAIPYESHRANFENTKGVETPFAGAGRSGNNLKNFHPTVKPTELMRYLIKLVTPAGGVVLDPFTGSGSTGKAALLDGYQFLGIELTDDYLPIIQGRLEWAETEALRVTQATAEKETERLF